MFFTYDADGYARVTVVDGSTLTGLYAADGSVNIVDRTSDSGVFGLYHPCGALNVVAVDGTSPVGLMHPSGALNAITGVVPGQALHPSGAVQVNQTIGTIKITLDTAYYVFSPQDINLVADVPEVLTLDNGSYTYTPQAINLKFGHAIGLTNASYTYSPQAITLTYSGAAATTPAQDLVDTWASGGAGSDGFAMVFEDAGGTDAPSIYIKDSVTPANDTDVNLTDDWDAFNSVLRYTSPSPKIVRQSDGDLKYCAHNLHQHSSDLTNAAWNNSASWITGNATTDPNGGSTAAAFVENGATTGVVYDNLGGIVSGALMSFSISAKAGTRNFLALKANNTGPYSYFNLSTGAVASTASGFTASIVDQGGGWYRCTVIGPSPGTATGVLFGPADSDGGVGYTGVLNDEAIYIWEPKMSYAPCDESLLSTTTAARFALPIQHDSSNNAEGLLVEPAATNLITNNVTHSSLTPTNASISTAAGTGPDGENSFCKLIDTSAGTQHYASVGLTVTSASNYTASVYIKDAGDSRYFQLRPFADGTGVAYATFNPANGSVVSSGGTGLVSTHSIDVGGGVYRVGITYTTIDTGSGILLCLTDTTTNTEFPSFSGDGSSGVLFYGLQYELGSVPTSPIITTGATATRAQDHIDIADTDTPVTAGPFTAYQKINLSRFTGRSLDFADGGNSNHYVQTSSSTLVFSSVDGITVANISNGGTQSLNTDIKLAVAVNTDDFAFSVGGAASGTDTSGGVGAFDEINFGIQRGGVNPMHGLIKEVLILPERLSNANLESLST